MNPEEYTSLDQIDREHWFYRGKRAIVRWWITHYLELKPDDLLIDGGMGTGTWLMEMSSSCRIVGLDSYEESLTIARPRIEAVGGQVLKTTLNQIDLPDGMAQVVTLLDVLEHLDDDAGALQEMIRLTRPDGLIVITVPALRWLWSDWDVTLQHRRRYHLDDFQRLVRQEGVEVLHCAYINSFLVFPIFLVRQWRKLFPVQPNTRRAEDTIPPSLINSLLYQSFVRPACWPWFHPPVGVSLLAVLRRKSACPAP